MAASSRPMMKRGLEILLVYGDGSRIARLTVPRWAIGVGAGLVLVIGALQGLVWTDYLSARRGDHLSARSADHLPTRSQPVIEVVQACPVSPAIAATPPAVPVTDPEQRKRNEAIQGRIDRIAAEVTSWASVHATIWRSVGPDHQKGREPRGVGGPASASVPLGTGDHSLTAQLDRLLVTVTEEGQKLRALNRFMARAGQLLAALPSRWPTRGAVNSEFGRRPSPWTGEPELHHGIDIAASVGTPVTAPGPATVTFVGSLPGYGNTVLLDHGHDVQSRFGHLHTIRVARGQRVQRGELIGLAGSTGRSTGPHLHYEVIVRGAPVNPRTYMWE